MSFLVVTPARNEAGRLPALAASLARQQPGLVGLWVVVDDGSTDGTAGCLPPDLPFRVEVVPRTNDGGLAAGSAFGAWRFGAEHGLARLPDAARVLKLDADILLADDYLAVLTGATGSLAGGRLQGLSERRRGDFVMGGLKAYDRAAYEVVRRLPVAVGFDVMDEVAVRAAGLTVQVLPDARATVSRLTGSSEGLARGRVRGGKVSRWTGYSPVYFALRWLRYFGRRPFLISPFLLLWGYVTAGPGPWPAELKKAHRREQHARLRRCVSQRREA